MSDEIIQAQRDKHMREWLSYLDQRIERILSLLEGSSYTVQFDGDEHSMKGATRKCEGDCECGSETSGD